MIVNKQNLSLFQTLMSEKIGNNRIAVWTVTACCLNNTKTEKKPENQLMPFLQHLNDKDLESGDTAS